METEVYYEVIWHGGIAEQGGGFTRGELLPPYDSRHSEANPAIVTIGSMADWEALKESDPSLKYIAAFGMRDLKFGSYGKPGGWTGRRKLYIDNIGKRARGRKH